MSSVARTAIAALLGLALAGCSMASSTAATAPAGVTQQLLIRSLERALAEIDRSKIGSHPVALEVAVQAGNEAFVKDFVTTWLKAHGVRMAGDSPEMKLKMFVSVTTVGAVHHLKYRHSARSHSLRRRMLLRG